MCAQSAAALQAEVELQGMKAEEKITIGNYVLARLEQLGIRVSFMASPKCESVAVYAVLY